MATNNLKYFLVSSYISNHKVIFLYIAFILGLAVTTHTYFFNLKEMVSLQGFSVLEYMEHVKHPENFSRDFPSGVFATGASIITLSYLPLQKLFEWSGIHLLYMMLCLEMLFVMAGTWVLWSALIKIIEPKDDITNNNINVWLYGWLCSFLLLGRLISPNLANIGEPYFHGQFYGFADGLRLAAIGFALSRRWGEAIAVLCFGFMIHPIKICFAAIFIIGMALIDWRDAFRPKNVILGCLGAIFAAIWSYHHLLSQFIDPIAPKEFVAYTRIFQHHWYPLDAGILTRYFDGTLSAFLGLMMLTLLALAQSCILPRVAYQMIAGLTLMAILSIVGIWISAHSYSIKLLTLCLLRASELMPLLAPFLILPGFWVKYRTQQWHWVAFYTVILLGSFITIKSMSSILAFLAVLFYFHEQRKKPAPSPATQIDKVLKTFTALSFVLFVYMSIKFPERLPTLILYAFIVSLGSILCWKLLLLNVPSYAKNFKFFLIGLSVCFFSSMGVFHKYLETSDMRKARDFYNIQIWAYNNTDITSLFMVDPCQTYGWRDFSSRSSIGTPREWFMTGWLYIPDNKVLDKGKKIAQTLGLDMQPYLVPRDRPVPEDTVCMKAQELFYNPDRKAIKRLTNMFDINYYVMLKNKADPVKQAVKALPVMENEYYIVYNAKDLIK
ncbi:MAG: hypothetical protein EBR02_00635 [Alphaproteobacteria bacterium]|nr:hypothetical protein [Alphaproteobacteria bacterium]